MYWTNFISFLCSLLIYKKGSIYFNIQFFMDKMKMVKKKRKMVKNLTLPHWDSNPRFLNKTFPPKIWILRDIRSIELMVLKKSQLYLTKNWHSNNYRTIFFHNLPHQRFRIVGIPLDDTKVGFSFNLHEIFESSVDLFKVYEAFRIFSPRWGNLVSISSMISCWQFLHYNIGITSGHR